MPRGAVTRALTSRAGGGQVTKYVEREIQNHRTLMHPHIVQFKEVRAGRCRLTPRLLATAPHGVPPPHPPPPPRRPRIGRAGTAPLRLGSGRAAEVGGSGVSQELTAAASGPAGVPGGRRPSTGGARRGTAVGTGAADGRLRACGTDFSCFAAALAHARG